MSIYQYISFITVNAMITSRPGSYLCSCPGGYELGEDSHICVDTNECVSNNGHGPCQDFCVNTEGSYYCTCETREGSRLASDGHSCEEQDMCAENVAKVSIRIMILQTAHNLLPFVDCFAIN